MATQDSKPLMHLSKLVHLSKSDLVYAQLNATREESAK